MLSRHMPGPLIGLLVALAALTACTTLPAPSGDESQTGEASPLPTVERWLRLQEDVSDMSTAQAVERLVQIEAPEGPGQLFYYGLLNQRLTTYSALIAARDTFQRLQEDRDLALAQRQLSDILRQYNQNRINAFLRQRELASEVATIEQRLEESMDEKTLLEQKIQALTDLEAVISTRKEH